MSAIIFKDKTIKEF